MASIHTPTVDRSSASRRTRPTRDATQGARRLSNATSVDGFLTHIASRDHGQARLSVAAFTASCCAAQLEAQCREVLLYRTQAPGPCAVEPLIVDLQRARARLGALLHQALAAENSSAITSVQPDSSFEERFRQQVAHERVLSDSTEMGVKIASLILTVNRLASQVRRLRSEVHGAGSSDHALLAGAATARVDVIEQGLRMPRVEDARVRSAAYRALCRLRPLCAVDDAHDADQPRHTVEMNDRSRLN